MGINQLIRAIKKYSKFLITSHINAEGDALGSGLALASLLRKLGKQAFIVNRDGVPENYSFLPGAAGIRQSLNKCSFQAAFIIDCADKNRIGSIAKLIDSEKPLINIDHHIDNKKFGKINWVDPYASSTGEMIYRLFKLTRTKLNRKDALNIYTAIVTDTGSFRHSNTTSATLRIASELLRFGIEPAKTYSRVYENNSVENILLVAKIISRLSFGAGNKIAWVKIRTPEFKKIQANHEILDKILDFAKSINTVKIVIIFSQVEKGLVKLSFRSKSPINVQRIAKIYDGGGHKFASGCTIKGSLKEAESKVLRQVKKTLNTIY